MTTDQMINLMSLAQTLKEANAMLQNELNRLETDTNVTSADAAPEASANTEGEASAENVSEESPTEGKSTEKSDEKEDNDSDK